VYQRFDAKLIAAAGARPPRRISPPANRHLPPDAAFTILVSSYPVDDQTTPGDVAALTDWLESSGFSVFHAEVDLGSRGRWHRVLAGAYTDSDNGRRDVGRVKAAVPQSDARVVSAAYALGLAPAAAGDIDAPPAGTEP
jgi:hypothetical protein